MMKRMIAIMLVIILGLSLCACGSKEPEFNPSDEFESKVNATVAVEYMYSYADVKMAMTNLSDIEVNGDTYTGKGKVTITDNYGDKYVGKVTAVYKYNEETQHFTKVSLDIETPRKQ